MHLQRAGIKPQFRLELNMRADLSHISIDAGEQSPCLEESRSRADEN